MLFKFFNVILHRKKVRFRSSVGLEQRPSKAWVLGSSPNGITFNRKQEGNTPFPSCFFFYILPPLYINSITLHLQTQEGLSTDLKLKHTHNPHQLIPPTLNALKLGYNIGVIHKDSFVLFGATNEHQFSLISIRSYIPRKALV